MSVRCAPALVECVDFDPVVCVFLQDLLGVLVSVERVHENQRHVGSKGFVKMLQTKQAKRDLKT